MKDIIVGISLMWLLPSSVLLTRIILYNLKIGKIKDCGVKHDKKN